MTFVYILYQWRDGSTVLERKVVDKNVFHETVQRCFISWRQFLKTKIFIKKTQFASEKTVAQTELKKWRILMSSCEQYLF